MRLRWNVEIHFDAVNACALDIDDSDADSLQPEYSRQSFQPIPVESDVDQRAEEHVPGDTAGWIDDGDSHLLVG
jgi:hypothetical protein